MIIFGFTGKEGRNNGGKGKDKEGKGKEKGKRKGKEEGKGGQETQFVSQTKFLATPVCKSL